MRRWLLGMALLGALPATAGESSPLSVDEFLNRAVKNDPRFYSILVDRLGYKYRESLRRPVADWVLDVMGDYTVDLADPPADPALGASLSLSKLIPATGTTLGLSASGDNLNQDPATRGWSASLSQDLAKNAFGRAGRLDTKIAGLETKLAEHQLVEAYEDYLASLATLYVRWYLSYESLRTAEASAAEAAKLLENIQERRRRNIALRVDVDKVRLQVLDKDERVLQLKTQWRQQAGQIARAAGLKDANAWHPSNPGGRWTWDPAWVDGFKEQSRTGRLLAAAQALDDAEYRRLKDDLLPSLKAGVSYGDSQTGGADPGGEVTAFLDLSVPLGWQRERARAGLARIQAEQRRADNRDSLDRALVSLRNLALEIESEDQRIDMTKRKIDLSERILKDESENYSYGRTTLNDVIRFVEGLEDDRFALVQRQSARAVLVLEALRLADRLVQNRKDLPELDALSTP